MADKIVEIADLKNDGYNIASTSTPRVSSTQPIEPSQLQQTQTQDFHITRHNKTYSRVKNKIHITQ